MRKVYFFFLFFIIQINYFLFSQNIPVKISYTGNMGVCITSGNSQVFIDALHNENKWDYLIPDEKIRSKILNRIAPYDNIKLSLATHLHDDHFNENFTGEFLQKNPSAKQIGSRQIYDKISNTVSFSEIKERVLVTDNSKNGIEKFDIDGIKITAYNLPHIWPERHHSVQNTGYLVEINNIKIFHAGDADSNLKNFTVFNLDKEKIDIAILPEWFISRGEPIINYLKPAKVIITHINPHNATELKSEVAKEKPYLVLFTELEEEFVYKK